MNSDSIYKINFDHWFRIALSFFLVAALLGTVMRLSWITELPLDYKNILHAHSHIAMLGWGFTIMAAVIRYVILKHTQQRRVFNIVLILNTLSGIGMMVSFSIQGYGAVSIAFSALHILVAYFFAYHALKELKTITQGAVKFFGIWSIRWMLISTLGLWAVAPVSILLGKLHPLYFASIQFFLHFQFNGWFLFGVLTFLAFFLDKKGFRLELTKTWKWLLQLSLLLTYALSITWSTPEALLFYLNSAGVIIQLIVFVMIGREIFNRLQKVHFTGSPGKILLLLGLACFALKIAMQSAVAIPYVAEISYTIRNFVIGFIHMIMLGAFSLSILALVISNTNIVLNRLGVLGCYLLAIGFLATEILLFTQGMLLWAEWGFMNAYYEMIFLLTVLLPISISLILWSQFNQTNVSNIPASNSKFKKIEQNIIKPENL